MHSAGMRADARENVDSHLTVNGRSRAYRPAAKFLRLSQLRKLRSCEQVAAVCYRVRANGIEFLLVRTNSEHWTFPKGKAEPGLTHAQAAALEAFEEAGVHGRIEEASFARYVRRKRSDLRDASRSAAKSAEKDVIVQAHLCEVSRLEPPQEPNRNPTWFSSEKAKRRLREDRTTDYSSELARVVDRAVSRIRRSRSAVSTVTRRPQKDALQKVQFIDSGRRTPVRPKLQADPKLFLNA
jgi:8-oxo-dGTP pyrophosphatase MutT (NUDIX family)